MWEREIDNPKDRIHEMRVEGEENIGIVENRLMDLIAQDIANI
jgi:hypothetical protein